MTLLPTSRRKNRGTHAAAQHNLDRDLAAPAARVMIGVRTHRNRWIVRDTTRSCAHAMVTQTTPDPTPTFRIVLCELFEASLPLPDETHSLAEAISTVEQHATPHSRQSPASPARDDPASSSDAATPDVLVELVRALTPPGAIHPALANSVIAHAHALARHPHRSGTDDSTGTPVRPLLTKEH